MHRIRGKKVLNHDSDLLGSLVRNWLTPYNYAFAISFLILGLIIPLRGIPDPVGPLLRLALIFLGIFLLVGTFIRQRASERKDL